jgi:hypothetical protein
MLDPQVAVNLLPKLGVGVDLVGHRNWLIWNVHLYSPFHLGLTAPNPRGTRNHLQEAL